MSHRALGQQWGQAWPDETTLGEAAHRMEFDTFDADPPADHVLVKQLVAVDDVARSLSQRHLDFSQDAQDRMTPIRQGLKHTPHALPPLVLGVGVTGSQLRDGHHRIKAAKEFGLTHVPAYMPKRSSR